MKHPLIHKIISGGQTGVDRAALDVALELNIAYGGWCPKNRLAEDKHIPEKYKHLQETSSFAYEERTTLNVKDSDGTLILLRSEPQGGSLFTIQEAQRLNKPYFIIDLSKNLRHNENIFKWLKENKIGIVNIAGPRESESPGIYKISYEFLLRLFY